MCIRDSKYTELYGEENAEFLLEQEKLWVRNYNTCGFITSPVYHNPEYPAIARQFAKRNGWDYVQIEGNTRMLQKLTRGAWNDRELLICPPGPRIEASFDEWKIKAVPCAGTGKD